VKVAFGRYEFDGQRAAVEQALPIDVTLLDVSLGRGQRFDYVVPVGTNAFIYVVRGAIRFADHEVTALQAASLGRAGGVLNAGAIEDTQLVLFLGQPLNEPIVRHGPFAMTNREDIQRAIASYQAGQMGSV
jgi:quercetin 2,3-dioxygenase